jgi:hypothetical protein
MTQGESYPLVWYWRRKLPERKGQACRVVTRARAMGSVLVEFVDGFKVVTGRHAVRRPQGKWSKLNPRFWAFDCCDTAGGGLVDWEKNECSLCGRAWYRPPMTRRKNDEQTKNQTS